MFFDRKQFFDEYRKEFDSLNQSVVNAMEFLLSGFESNSEWNDIAKIAYAFSTIKHETAHTFLPITEYGEPSYFKKYDGRTDLGNNQPGDGAKFKGRGYVQITGRKNYTRFAKILGIDIVKNPEMTLKSSVAFSIMTIGMHKGYFTGKKLSDYITPTKTDYRNARRIINGTDKAATLATYAKKFENVLARSVTTKKPAPVKIADTFVEPATEPSELIAPPELVPTVNEIPSDNITTEQTVKTEVETPTGTATVETKVESQQKVAIEKTKPKNFVEKIKAKFAGLFGGAVTVDVATEYAAKANTLGLSSDAWKRIFWIAVFSALAYLIYLLVDHVISMKRDKELTNGLVVANTTPNNIVQLVDADKLDEYKALGYEIVRR